MVRFVNSKDKMKIDLSQKEIREIERIIEDYKELLIAVGNL